MIKKVKIRDMTKEQFDQFCRGYCCENECEACPFFSINCASAAFIERKEMFSDKFLDQEVEIEVPDILTKEEKEWLRKTVEMALFKVVSIEVCIYQYKFIYVNYENKDKSKCAICFPVKDGWFKGMEEGRRYTLEELGL